MNYKAGDLVVGTFYNSQKFHICKIRGPHPRAKNEKNYGGLWAADSLCGVGSKYYMDQYRNPGLPNEGDQCSNCFRLWKSGGEKPLVGLTDLKPSPQANSPWPLPFAWKEVATIGHPYDVAEGGNPELVRDSKGDIVGVVRKELRRWQRGHQVVRIVFSYENSSWQVLTHTDMNPTKESRFVKVNQESVSIEHAWRCMAKGGRS